MTKPKPNPQQAIIQAQEHLIQEFTNGQAKHALHPNETPETLAILTTATLIRNGITLTQTQ